jgi:hypothetical protein
MANGTPTQTKHPWRATVRTWLAAVVGLLPFLPTIAHEFGMEGVGWVAAGLGIVGGVTRLLAVPGINGWLQRYASVFAASSPATPDTESEPRHRV